eukprot:13747464-Alexandrium_andersonii.AAC.1
MPERQIACKLLEILSIPHAFSGSPGTSRPKSGNHGLSRVFTGFHGFSRVCHGFVTGQFRVNHGQPGAVT